MQCLAKKFDYKLTKRTVTDLFFKKQQNIQRFFNVTASADFSDI